MMSIDCYAPLRQSHIGLVGVSVALFVARGLGVLGGAAWPMRAGVRRLSVSIDTLLLTAGGALWWLLGLRPERDHWLLVKLVLVVVYVVLGSLALKRAPTGGTRALAFVAALACVWAVVTIALTHDAAAPLRMVAPPSSGG
jgi:uncharacterized membrane protein SirB2